MDVFVARQPIFDLKKNVVAYELLFRSGLDNFYDDELDGDNSTAKLISNSFLIIGLDTITKRKKAFINFTQKHILSGAPTAIPNDLISIEILEDVKPDHDVVAACAELKEKGYEIVLDDFVYTEEYKPLIELADIIKVDFLATKGDRRREVVQQCIGHDVKFLAEKVETDEDFQMAVEFGYDYFQGYFFSKPVIIAGRDIPGMKFNHLRMLSEINNPEVEFDRLEDIIKHDVSLTYKLLKFINSAYFRFSMKVESIKHSLVLLGVKEIKKWASIIALSAIGDDKPKEVVSLSLIRAKFCEFLATDIGKKNNESDYFMTGLFSLIDALIDRPMEDVLNELPISDDVKNALLGEKNSYYDIYNLVVAYEKGEWAIVTEYSKKSGVNEAVLPTYYFTATKWANVSF